MEGGRHKQKPRVVVTMLIANSDNTRMQHGDLYYGGLVMLLHHCASDFALTNETRRNQCWQFRLIFSVSVVLPQSSQLCSLLNSFISVSCISWMFQVSCKWSVLQINNVYWKKMIWVNLNNSKLNFFINFVLYWYTKDYTKNLKLTVHKKVIICLCYCELSFKVWYFINALYWFISSNKLDWRYRQYRNLIHYWRVGFYTVQIYRRFVVRQLLYGTVRFR